MRLIATDVAWSLPVCLLVTTMTCAETDKPIEMLFAVWTRVGTRNHVGGPDGMPRGEGETWGGSPGPL